LCSTHRPLHTPQFSFEWNNPKKFLVEKQVIQDAAALIGRLSQGDDRKMSCKTFSVFHSLGYAAAKHLSVSIATAMETVAPPGFDAWKHKKLAENTFMATNVTYHKICAINSDKI